LDAALKNARKTHIIAKANLNAKLLKKYLPTLIERGLILKTKEQYTNLYLYRTTPKGEKFLHRINTLIQVIEAEEE
jgi:predicted transcriptional regulator